ncbi:FHA domain-containing protein [Corynebacterium argentoratense]|uniref:FHA domain-containing protein FhaB/FipA n=1 Tax=Corynebacterium argentoratense TaxID=42817 RepID=UPI001F241F7E|nr:FHA domain-containing protein [Corynebacterium argentoratense]MCF1712238.1 FHA domain-containing protein [Corynebacterium argentoratense]
MELAFRIGLLVVLWVFIFAVLRELRRDLSGVGGAPAAPVMTARGSASALPSPSAGGVQDAATAASPSVPGSSDADVLEVIGGPAYDLSGFDQVVIGRHPECDIVIADDFASSRHARLFRHPGSRDWFVEDLNSRNGTFVGQWRVEQPERVSDVITVGQTALRMV